MCWLLNYIPTRSIKCKVWQQSFNWKYDKYGKKIYSNVFCVWYDVTVSCILAMLLNIIKPQNSLAINAHPPTHTETHTQTHIHKGCSQKPTNMFTKNEIMDKPFSMPFDGKHVSIHFFFLIAFMNTFYNEQI